MGRAVRGGDTTLSEHIRIAKNRVDIFDWEDEAERRGVAGGDTNLSWIDPAVDDITGGYLFESSDEYDERAKFTVAAAVLPIAFANASEGDLRKGQALRLSYPVGGNVATVGVYVNGPKVGAPIAPVDGRIDMAIPPSALTAAVGEPNCVSLVAFDAQGAPIARNYALVRSLPSEIGTMVHFR